MNSALLSRCQVYTLNVLDADAIQILLLQALEQDDFLKERNIHIEEFEALIQFVSRCAQSTEQAD